MCTERTALLPTTSPRMRRLVAALRTFTLLTAIAACAPNPRTGTPVAAVAPRSGPTLVVLVRHAEKVDASADPALSAAGEARAVALAETLRDARVSAIVTTQFRRTRETAAPLAARLGIAPQVVDAGGADHAAAVADAVRRLSGVVLVVGHSNTIPAIVGALGAPRPPDLCDGNYDTMFVVALSPGASAPSLVRARFGMADADAAAGCPPMRGD